MNWVSTKFGFILSSFCWHKQIMPLKDNLAKQILKKIFFAYLVLQKEKCYSIIYGIWKNFVPKYFYALKISNNSWKMTFSNKKLTNFVTKIDLEDFIKMLWNLRQICKKHLSFKQKKFFDNLTNASTKICKNLIGTFFFFENWPTS